MEHRARLFILICSVWLGYVQPSWGIVFKTLPQALSDVRSFSLQAEKKTLFLDQHQVQIIEAEIHDKLNSQMIGRIYLRDAKNKNVATAYIDTHKIRKETQTIMIVMGVNGMVEKIEVLSFNEPPGYEASDTWLNQFHDLEQAKAMSKYASVLPESGSTLTSDAIVKAVQKIVAIDQLSR